MREIILIGFLASIGLNAFASHIVGGDIYYDYLGNDEYKIYLNLFIDCQNGNPAAIAQDNQATIGIFKNNGNSLFKSITMTKRKTINIKKLNYNCLDTPSNVCVDKFEFYTTVTLPDVSGGYIISYQRCCRNNTILNVSNPGSTGATYFVKIPERKLYGDNSSPRFLQLPPNFLCLHKPFRFLHAAKDPDGDSLAYELVVPYEGASVANPRPLTPEKPPYKQLLLLSPYNKDYLINAAPKLWIDSTTGFMRATPRRFGQYSVAIAVKEYRNGQLLSTVVRDFQFNVIGCSFDLISAFANPLQECDLDVEFENQSQGATNFFWDFGDLATKNDTSSLKSPTYKYPTTGTYIIKLIASNPSCSDTFYKTLVVNPDTGDFAGKDVRSCNGEPIEIGPDRYMNNAKYNWSPGNLVADSTKRKTVVIPNKSFQVVLTQQFGYCWGNDTVNILYGPPKLDFRIDTFAECEKRTYQFTSTGEGDSVIWKIGKEKSPEIFNGKKAIKTFESAGVIQAKLITKINATCVDSLIEDINVNFDSLSFAGPDKEICFGNSIEIGDTANFKNVDYNWFPDSLIVNPELKQQLVKPIKTTQFFLKRKSENCELLDSVLIKVDKPEPKFKIEYAAPCDGKTVKLYNESINCERFNWDFGKTSGQNNSTAKDSIVVNYTDNRVYTIKLEGLSKKGCKRSFSADLNVSADTAFFAGADANICKHDSIQIGYVDSLSKVEFKWYKNDTLLNLKSSQIRVSPNDTSVYVLLKEYPECVFADSVLINVENPKALFEIDYEAQCDVFEIPIKNKSKRANSEFNFIVNGLSSKADFDSLRYSVKNGSRIYHLKFEVRSDNCINQFEKQMHVFKDTGVQVVPDSTICFGDSIYLGFSDTSKNARYSWTPNLYLNDSEQANPLAKPDTSVIYKVVRSFRRFCN